MEKQYPHLQPFDKDNAVAAMQERIQNSKVGHAKLRARQKDYEKTVSSKTGFNMPGSNKK